MKRKRIYIINSVSYVPSAAQVERHKEFPLNAKISQYIPFYTTDGFGIATAETILRHVWTATFLKTIFGTESDILWYLII